MEVRGEKDKNLWFRAKRYGYGWYPVTWQGWSIVLMYVFSIFSESLFVDKSSHSASDTLISFFPRLFILTTFLIIICETKGEPGGWRWGRIDQKSEIQ